MVESTACELAPTFLCVFEELLVTLGGTVEDLGGALASGLAVLGHPVRREVLRLLADNDHLDRSEISTSIAADDDLCPDRVERAELLLHHSHLPKLDQHHYVAYDPQSGDVTLLEAPDSVASTTDGE
jgi:DNA-binding transcriptional ArsR family regulator